MTKMRFMPELAEFLNEHGYIYTVRKFRYPLTEGCVEIDGVGRCQRARIGEASKKSDLEPYADRSGFKTVDDWWKKIKELNRGYVGPFYVYEVTTKDRND